MQVLRIGNVRQQAAYHAIQKLEIMEALADYHPTLCGTMPLEIDVEGSDLDIILEVEDFDHFKKDVMRLYQNKEGFRLKEKMIRGNHVVKANFLFLDFEFELFGQDLPVTEQNAYIHMVIEHTLLKHNPSIKERVITLKQEGMKTEPAFCMVLGINGNDPYQKLIEYGKQLKVVKGIGILESFPNTKQQ
jgi:Domain of unknown function (DUF4269)